MTDGEFKTIVNLLEGAFRTEMVNKERDAYWLILKEADGKSVLRRAILHCRSGRSKYGFPRPAELLEETTEDTATLAWCKVRKAMTRYGAWESVDLEDPAIHLAVDLMGGWPYLCSVPEHELHYRHEEFEKFYRVHAANPASMKDAPKYLVGESERINAESRMQARQTPRKLSEKPRMVLLPAAKE